MAEFDYDLFVIGGGSGGVRAARVSGAMGKRVALAEADRYGGTCVIRGCVPKKLFVYASQFPDQIETAASFGWQTGKPQFSWQTLIENKDSELERLENLYRKGLTGAGVETFNCHAALAGPHEILLDDEGRTVTARNILIATGGLPNRLESLPGHEFCITSNEAFDLEQLPGSIVINGGGYIAVEFAGIFAGLGVDTTLVYRGDHLLRGFDHDLGNGLAQALQKRGIRLMLNTNFSNVTARGSRRAVEFDSGETLECDCVMLAVGRLPNTLTLGLEAAGVETDRLGAICVDDYSRTNVGHIFAVGDVTNRVALTPVAIHEAMCFVETVFRDNKTAPDHGLIPTAVFSQPEIGTLGMSEETAIREELDVDIYRSVFRPMKYSLSGKEEKMLMKIIVGSKDDKVLGVHLFGPDAGEMIQLLGIALKMGATKADFDRTMAVHPTAAEELVTMRSPSYRIVAGEKQEAA